MRRKILAWAAFLFFAVGFVCAAGAALPAPQAPRALSAAAFDTSLLPKTYATPVPGDSMQVTVHRLPNGLTIYLSPNKELPRIEAWIAVRAGSAQDPGETTGLAHYLEHMLFKGSSRLGTLDYKQEKHHLEKIAQLYEKLFHAVSPKERAAIYREIDKENVRAGDYAVTNELDKLYKTFGFTGLNAFTSPEQTVYVVNMPANRLETWALLESERFQAPVFRLFQTEIETVFEEKNQSLDDAGSILYEAVQEALYPGHPYGRSVLGSIEHLKNPSLAKMYTFYNTHYAPNNMAVALAGDFDRAQALEILARYFGSWKQRPVPKPGLASVARPNGVKRVDVQYEAEEEVVIAWPTVKQSHPDYYPLIALDMLMDNSAAGIINLELNQKQKVKSAGSYPNMNNEAGHWQLWAVAKKDQSLKQAEALLMETVASLKSGAFSDEDLRAVITDFEVSEKKRFESNAGRTGFMIDAFTSFEDWEKKVRWLEAMRRVKKDDVLRVARLYLGPNRVVAYRRRGKPDIASIQKPQFSKVQIEPARESKFFKQVLAMTASPIEPRWLARGKDYEFMNLPSGTLYAAKNPMNDLFALSFNFERGFRHDRGLCFAFDLLDLSGAGPWPAEAFKKKLYSLGTTVRLSCGRDNSAVYLEGLESHLEESLELMRLRFSEPNIGEDTFEKMIEVELGRRRDNKLDPDQIHDALGAFAQEGERSAVLAELSNDELYKLEEQNLIATLKTMFDDKHRVGYVGTRTASDLRPILMVKGKKYQAAPKRQGPIYVKPETTRVFLVHRDMVQSQIGFFAADEKINPKRWADYTFYSRYMGGGMSSVIFQEIRESRALAYAAMGYYAPADWRGEENIFYGYVGSQADKTLEAAKLFTALVHDMPASRQRFRETREFLLESHRSNPIKFRQIPGAVMEWEQLGFNKDPRPQRFKQAQRYTLEELERFSERFAEKPLTIFILGNKERVALKDLEALGSVTVLTLEQIFPY